MNINMSRKITINVNVSMNVSVKYKCKHKRHTHEYKYIVCSILSVHTDNSHIHLPNMGAAKKRHLAPFSKRLRQD